MDLVILQHWLLRFGEVISDLRVIVLSFTECLENHLSPWMVHQAMVSRRLIRIDKNWA